MANSNSAEQLLLLENQHLYTRTSISPTDLMAIPIFEKDYRDLPMFIESCEEFLETYYDKNNSINPINSYLIKLIKSRLNGDARHLVSIRECKTWPDIKQLLETNFGDQRTEENLFHELINFKSDKGHDYHAIGVEIRTLLTLTLAKCRLSIFDESELKIKENLYKKVALNTYLRNLYSLDKNVADPVRFQNPATLEDAMRLVVEEMNWQHSCFSLQYSSSQRQAFNAPYRPPPAGNTGIYGQSQAPQANPTQQFFGKPASASRSSNLFGEAPAVPAATTGFTFGGKPLDQLNNVAKGMSSTTSVGFGSTPIPLVVGNETKKQEEKK